MSKQQRQRTNPSKTKPPPHPPHPTAPTPPHPTPPRACTSFVSSTSNFVGAAVDEYQLAHSPPPTPPHHTHTLSRPCFSIPQSHTHTPATFHSHLLCEQQVELVEVAVDEPFGGQAANELHACEVGACWVRHALDLRDSVAGGRGQVLRTAASRGEGEG
eukprot:207117-Chlamydomonas_euryale.AAC.1